MKTAKDAGKTKSSNERVKMEKQSLAIGTAPEVRNRRSGPFLKRLLCLDLCLTLTVNRKERDIERDQPFDYQGTLMTTPLPPQQKGASSQKNCSPL